MKFCGKCGKELFDEAVICPGCGCATDVQAPPAGISNPTVLLNQLSEKVKINAIIWFVIAGIQIALGIFVNWVVLIVGVLNIISAIGDLQYSKEVLVKPVGIVKKFEPLAMPIIVLVYNFLIGGIIGVAGSVYYLVAIRGFVLGNRAAFDAFEREYASENL